LVWVYDYSSPLPLAAFVFATARLPPAVPRPPPSHRSPASHHLGVGLRKAEADALRVLEEFVGADVDALGLREGGKEVSTRVGEGGRGFDGPSEGGN